MSEALSGRVIDHEHRSVLGGHGVASIVVGLVALAAGTLPILRALGVITQGRLNAPPWIVILCGGIFVVAGLAAIGAGLQSLRRRRRARRLGWRGDFLRDDPRRIVDDNRARALRWLPASIGAAVLLTPAHAIAIKASAPWPVLAVLGLFDLLTLASLFVALGRFFRACIVGAGRLELEHAPIAPGSAVRGELVLPERLGSVAKLDATLRYVIEGVRVERVGQRRLQRIVRLEQAATRITVSHPGRRVPLDLPLPGPQATAFAGTPSGYWELDVRADAASWSAWFPLPVYAGVE